MIYICYSNQNNSYFFLTDTYFSSDFDFLEQLIDVNIDDPEKRAFYPNETPESIINNPAMSDVTVLCKVNTFDEIESNYPELFI